MTPLLLFLYLLAVAAGLLVIGLVGIALAALFFWLMGTNENAGIFSPTPAESEAEQAVSEPPLPKRRK